MTDSPLIDRRDLAFLLHDWLDLPAMCAWPRFAGHDRETFDAVVEAAQALALSHFANHHRLADVQEPRVVDGRVQLPPETRAAIEAYAAAGFPGATVDAEAGGMQLPYTVALACDALFAGANVATAGYVMLARGVANLLAAHGSPAQQARYLPGLRSGRFLGTMCLSEPQAGSSLGDLATRAEPDGEGGYRLRGSKMWISGGEHELAENIIHLVLARLPGAPPGVKGISLFIVPRYRLDADGRPGEPNDVVLAGLNHKLGQRGIVNTFLSFGERGDCRAELVGAPNQGLAQMFHMMNEARIGVGVGAVMLGLAGYRHSLAYARERRQGRHPEQKDPATPPVPIIEHADVRRMLLQQKALAEGALALALQAATLVDTQAHAPDAGARREAGLLLELLTPVVKAWSAEACVAANDLAIQVLGGYGYTREYPVEQYWRDNRLNPIHEGSNGIQALDLLGRKVLMGDGAALALLLRDIGATVAAAGEVPALSARAAALADASAYLTATGHVVVAWTWLRLALVAHRQQPSGAGDAAHLAGKRAACDWFFRAVLPLATPLFDQVEAGDGGALACDPAWL